MAISIKNEPTPLNVDNDGVVLVGNTRVTLDTVIVAYLEGDTAEEITQQYPSLDLADIYAVISYYLRNQPQVESYLKQRKERVDSVTKENEKRFNPQGIRARLLSRRGRIGN